MGDSRGPAGASSARPNPLLIFLEGLHDITCFQKFSQLLRTVDPSVPDLSERERSGQVIFIPMGGSNLGRWIGRFRALGLREFHLYDGEAGTLRAERQRIVDAINRWPGSTARLTRQRTLENYLHPEPVSRVFAAEIWFDDQDDVSETVARAAQRKAGGPDWEELTSRGRRLKDRIKQRLHQEVLPLMTFPWLTERDPRGEVPGWFQFISRLLSESSLIIP